MSVADNIKRLRTDAGMTQAELADKLGVTRPTITQWETGWSSPRMGSIEKLADIFKVSKSRIVEDTKPVHDELTVEVFEIIEHMDADTRYYWIELGKKLAGKS